MAIIERMNEVEDVTTEVQQAVAEVEKACRKVQDLPLFRSEWSAAEFQKWLVVANAFLKDCNIQDDIRLHILMMRLDERLQSHIYRAGVYDWPMAEVLLKHFFEGDDEEPHYLDIVDYVQETNESVAEFMARIKETAALSSKQVGEKLPESLLMECFCAGVRNPFIRQYLLESSEAAKNPEELVALAEAILKEVSEGEDDNTQEPEETDNSKVTSSFSCSAASSIVKPGRGLGATTENQAQVLQEVLTILKEIRKRRTRRSYYQAVMLQQPGLSAIQKKIILERPPNDWAELSFQLEVDPFFFDQYFCFRMGRTLLSYSKHIPRAGAVVSWVTNGKPWFTPGVWIARLFGPSNNPKIATERYPNYRPEGWKVYKDACLPNLKRAADAEEVKRVMNELVPIAHPQEHNYFRAHAKY